MGNIDNPLVELGVCAVVVYGVQMFSMKGIPSILNSNIEKS